MKNNIHTVLAIGNISHTNIQNPDTITQILFHVSQANLVPTSGSANQLVVSQSNAENLVKIEMFDKLKSVSD